MAVMKSIEQNKNVKPKKRKSGSGTPGLDGGDQTDGKTNITNLININVVETNEQTRNLLGSKNRQGKDGAD